MTDKPSAVRLAAATLGAAATQAAFLISVDHLGSRHVTFNVQSAWWVVALPVFEVVALATALQSRPRWLTLTGCGLVALASAVTFLLDAALVVTAVLLGLLANGVSRKFGGSGLHPGSAAYLILALAILATVLNVFVPPFAWNRARSA